MNICRERISHPMATSTCPQFLATEYRIRARAKTRSRTSISLVLPLPFHPFAVLSRSRTSIPYASFNFLRIVSILCRYSHFRFPRRPPTFVHGSMGTLGQADIAMCLAESFRRAFRQSDNAKRQSAAGSCD